MKKKILCFFVLLGYLQGNAQVKEANSEVIPPDSVLLKEEQKSIHLEDVNAYSIKLGKEIERKYYHWLERRVDDIYPFLQRAVTEYYMVKDSAQNIVHESDRKKYIKKRYNDLAEIYENKLKDLSTSRGQILSKLIYKEIGKSTYDVIKELRGGASAFLWNAAGGAFDIDLKQGFEPEKIREDLYIAVILQRGLASGKYKPINKHPVRKRENLIPIFRALGIRPKSL